MKYDGQLIDLLPLLHVLIMNETEAEYITGVSPSIQDEMHSYWDRIAQFFYPIHPQLYVVVTLGDKGAVVVQNSSILGYKTAPVSFQDPVDTTGAGDAFAAGFLYGSICERKGDMTTCTVEDILNGLEWGCLTGTSCTMRQGASIPATHAELMDLKKTVV